MTTHLVDDSSADHACTVAPVETSAPRRSTAGERRQLVVGHAVACFAAGGWAGTTVVDVAAAAGISPAYVAKLFPKKEQLFVAALDSCFDRIAQALTAAAATTATGSPEDVLDQLGDAYAHLITDRPVLMLQVHAQSAAAVPAIGDALRRGLERLTMLVSTTTGADDAAVQRFLAYGQLCHLVVTTRIDQLDTPWAHLLTAGIRHYEDED